MGAYSTEAMVDAQMQNSLLQHIARPVVAGMKAEGADYKGVLYCGLMMTARGPMVLEFNCRFGDPETQPVLMRLESDLVEALEASIDGRVSDGDFRWSADASVCVVMASGGYPGTFEMGKKISGLEDAERVAGVRSFTRVRRSMTTHTLPRVGECWGLRLERVILGQRLSGLTKRRQRSASVARTIARTLRHGR